MNARRLTVAAHLTSAARLCSQMAELALECGSDIDAANDARRLDPLRARVSALCEEATRLRENLTSLSEEGA